LAEPPGSDVHHHNGLQSALKPEDVEAWSWAHSQLKKAQLLHDDISKYEFDVPVFAVDATVVFRNNIRFTPKAINALTKVVCRLPDARMLITAVPLCPRHRSSCRSEQCLKWKLYELVEVSGSWTSKPVLLYVYRRGMRDELL